MRPLNPEGMARHIRDWISTEGQCLVGLHRNRVKGDRMSEFTDVEFELDAEESEALLKMLREPNPKAQQFRERAKWLFEGVDITANEIPLKQIQSGPCSQCEHWVEDENYCQIWLKTKKAEDGCFPDLASIAFIKR